MELSHDKIKIKDILDWKRKNMLKVNPEYQRGAVWKAPQQKKLIDSIFRGYPLPLIYLHYKKETIAGMTSEGLEIIDGQQRINALYTFGENALKLFDPIKDDKIARFPNFIKRMHCSWASCDFIGLSDELRERFNNTELLIVKVVTDNEDEARDLFIRLQAGLPLNAQEKRDAWPGGYTEFVLKFGGKKELTRYPGHDFFKKHIHIPTTDRGAIRTLCAQIGMLFFEGATKGNWMDIGTQPVDDYYYRNLDFDITSPQVARFSKILDLAVELFQGYKGPKLKVHEAIHIILYLDSLFEDYTKSWYEKFIPSLDLFRAKTATDTKAKSGEFWYKYGSLISTAAASSYTIQKRHKFFSENMIRLHELIRKDYIRTYGQLEREIIYYRDYKICAVCKSEINWNELEIHHLDEHQNGGQTTIDNGLPVHKDCHPKGQAATNFFNDWKVKQQEFEEIKKINNNEDEIKTYSTMPKASEFEILPDSKQNKVINHEQIIEKSKEDKIENEIKIFIDRIGAAEFELNIEEKKFYRRSNYFKFVNTETLLIVKISRSEKPFYGVSSRVIEFADKQHDNYYLILLTSNKSGWVFSKREINSHITNNDWREAEDKNYKVNTVDLFDKYYFSSYQEFLDKTNEQNGKENGANKLKII